MSVPAPATAGPPPAQTHAKTSTAILQGADAIMALFSEEIAKATQQYQQQVQDLERQLATTISVFESTTAALEQLRKERDNAVAAAQYASEDRRKAVEEKDGLQRELQDATVREEVAGVAARRRDTILLAHQASLDAHRKDKLARDNLVNQLKSDISTLTDAIRDEKAKGEAEAAAKDKAHQALRREMDSCAYRLRQDVAKVATERDAALAEVAGLKETATTLQSSITSLEAERDAARAEVQKKADEAEALRLSQISFKEAAATAEAERDEATRKLTERLAGFELAAASLTTERDGARAEVQKHLEELSTRATRISELEADKAKASLIPDLQEELARQGAILIQRDSQLSQLKDTHTKTLAKLSQLEKEKAEADVLVEDLQKKCARHLPILAQRDLQIGQLKETHTKAIEKLETAMSDEKDRVKRSEQDHKKRLLQRDGTISRMQSQAGRLNTDLTSALSDIERLQSEKESVEGLLKAAVAEQARTEAAVAVHVKQVSERDAEIARLLGRLSKLQEKVESLESDLDSRAATISQLEAEKAASLIDDQKEKLDAMLSQRDEQISRLKQSNGKIRTKLDAARTALADKKSRAQEAEEAQTKLLSERDDTISDLETRLASTQSDISRLESEKQTVEGVLQTVVAERARAEASLATHAKLLSKRDEEIAKLHDDTELPRALEKAKSLESALAQAHEEKAKLSRKATRLLGEVDRLQVALGSSKKSASEKQAADVVLQRVVAERSRAETAVTSLTSERDALKEQLSTMEAEIKTLREQASTSRVPVLEQNMRERDKRITELQNAIAASKNHIVHLQTSATDEKSRLWKQLEVVSAERSTAQTALAALKSELQDLKSQGPSQMQRQVKALTEERDALRKTPAALIQERDVLVGKVRERDEAIEKVRLHIPPQIVALEAEVRKLGEERDALQAQAHNVEAIMSALRDEVGLEFSISDNTFSIGERCVPVLTHLIELGQRVQAMCGDLAVAQGDLTGDDDGEGDGEGTTILKLDELHPFRLARVLGIVRDWMGAAVKTGEGWERMYGETVKEAVKLREGRGRDRARVERTERLERSLKAKNEELVKFRGALEREGIVYDDKSGGHGGFVFTGKLLECVKEIAPCVAGVMRTGKAVQDERVENLMRVEDTDPRTPMGVMRQMRKWMGVAQVVCEVVWERCGVLERERVGRRKERVKDKDKSEAPASTSRESLADITTRSAPKRASTSMASSASARVAEPPKKKRKIVQEASSSSSTQKAVAKEEEEEEDELMALARVLSAPSSRNGKGKGKRPVPVPIPWSSSSARPPPSKG